MKVDPKTAHRIAAGEVTAVLRQRDLARAREPVQFERLRGDDDAQPKHADDTTVLDTKCHVRVVGQREVTLGELTDADAKRIGFRSVFMFRQAMNDAHERIATPAWNAARRFWLVDIELDHSERPLYLSKTVGYTESPSQALDGDAPVVPPHVVTEVNKRRSKGLGHDAQEELRRRAARVRAAKLRDSEVKALNRGVDISVEVAAIENYLAAIREKIGEAA